MQNPSAALIEIEIELPPAVKKLLQHNARKRGLTTDQLIKEIIEDYVARRK